MKKFTGLSNRAKAVLSVIIIGIGINFHIPLTYLKQLINQL